MDFFQELAATIQSVSSPTKQVVAASLATIWWAFVGRMLWHVHEVQKNKRKFWSPALIWEIITAIGIGFVADGVGEWLGITGGARTALIVGLSYLGPRGVEQFLYTWSRNYHARNGGS